MLIPVNVRCLFQIDLLVRDSNIWYYTKVCQKRKIIPVDTCQRSLSVLSRSISNRLEYLIFYNLEQKKRKNINVQYTHIFNRKALNNSIPSDMPLILLNQCNKLHQIGFHLLFLFLKRITNNNINHMFKCLDPCLRSTLISLFAIKIPNLPIKKNIY